MTTKDQRPHAANKIPDNQTRMDFFWRFDHSTQMNWAKLDLILKDIDAHTKKRTLIKKTHSHTHTTTTDCKMEHPHDYNPESCLLSSELKSILSN